MEHQEQAADLLKIRPINMTGRHLDLGRVCPFRQGCKMQIKRLPMPAMPKQDAVSDSESVLQRLRDHRTPVDKAAQQALTQQLMDLRFGIFGPSPFPPYFIWPAGLFIPSAADALRYWTTPCPDTNRYDVSHTEGNGGQTADIATGTMSVRMAATPIDTVLRGAALVGCTFTPQVGRSQYWVRPTVNVETIITRDVPLVYQAGFPNSCQTRQTTSLSTHVWEINPADHSVELLPFSTVATVFDRSDHTFGGQPDVDRALTYSGTGLGLKVELQGNGRSYYIAVIARAYIAQTVLDAGGKPLTKVPEHYDYNVTALIMAQMPQITVDQVGPIYKA
jgi:hypothetical protein